MAIDALEHRHPMAHVRLDPASENHMPTFPFTGTVKEVRFDLSGEAIQDAEAEMRHTLSKH